MIPAIPQKFIPTCVNIKQTVLKNINCRLTSL